MIQCLFDGFDKPPEFVRFVAHRRKLESAVAADEDVARDVVRGVAVVDASLRVEPHGEVVALLLAESRHGFAALAAGDGQEDEVFAYETVDDVGLHACKLLPAGRAPRCPEVEQNHLAAQVGEGDMGAVEHFDREVGGRVAWLDQCGGVGRGAVGAAAVGQQQDGCGDGGYQRQHDPELLVALFGCHFVR